MTSDFLNLKQISIKFQLTPNELLLDYLGFGQTDAVLSTRDDFITKLQTAKCDLQVLIALKGAVDESVNQVTKSIVAMKLKMPFFFIDKLFHYIEHDINERLVQFRFELYENRFNLMKLNQLIINFTI